VIDFFIGAKSFIPEFHMLSVINYQLSNEQCLLVIGYC